MLLLLSLVSWRVIMDKSKDNALISWILLLNALWIRPSEKRIFKVSPLSYFYKWLQKEEIFSGYQRLQASSIKQWLQLLIRQKDQEEIVLYAALQLMKPFLLIIQRLQGILVTKINSMRWSSYQWKQSTITQRKIQDAQKSSWYFITAALEIRLIYSETSSLKLSFRN